MGKLLEQRIPLWVVALGVLASLVFTTAFGWVVLRTAQGKEWPGTLGRVAVAIASFPSLAKSVFVEKQVDIIDTYDAYRAPRPNIDLAAFRPLPSNIDLNLDGLMVRHDPDLLDRYSGWRLLVGTFAIDGTVSNAALAISPSLQLEKVWILTEEEIPGREPRPSHRRFIHGFDLVSDGSVIFSWDGGVSLQRFDHCGARIWVSPHGFHHSVTIDSREEFAWSLMDGSTAAKVSIETGAIQHSFTMEDIIAANPDIDILAIMEVEENDVGGNSRNTAESRLQGFHLNDVDPLPEEYSDSFERFEAGDLVISARNLNLIFVIDPESLKVKWWSFGNTRRQHDPDWNAQGFISVFDNRMSRDYSRIIGVDPNAHHQARVLFDGSHNDFYTRIRGKHQYTDVGTLLITSSQQGRVFEADPEGFVFLEFANLIPGDAEFNYTISEALMVDDERMPNFEDVIRCD